MTKVASTPAVDDQIRDESASQWVESALRSALDRDPADAVNDPLLQQS